MLKYFYFTLFTIVILIVGCGQGGLFDLDPCQYDVGDEIKITTYESGINNVFSVNIDTCDNPVIVRVDKPIAFMAGDVLKFEITKKKSSHSYIARLII